MRFRHTSHDSQPQTRITLADIADEVRQRKQESPMIWAKFCATLIVCVVGGILFGLTTALMLGVLPIKAIMLSEPSSAFFVGLLIGIVNSAIILWFRRALCQDLVWSGLTASFAFSATSVVASGILLILSWGVLMPNLSTGAVARLWPLDEPIFALFVAFLTQRCIHRAQVYTSAIDMIHHTEATERLLEKSNLQVTLNGQPIAISQLSCLQEDDHD